MLNFLNRFIQKCFKKKHKPKSFREIDPVIHEVFKKNGYGVYLANIKVSSGASFVGKAIAKFSGNFVHSILIFYVENIKNYFDTPAIEKINTNLSQYYQSFSGSAESIPILIIGSADEIGINCCSFSNYQRRDFTLRKLPTTELKIKFIGNEIVKTLGDPYDATGLFGFLFNKILDDKKTHYCSELCYDACMKAGIKISDVENPSPYDIEKYNKYQIVYKSF